MCERTIVMENKSNRLRDLPKREQDKVNILECHQRMVHVNGIIFTQEVLGG
jgi:hypothetical protein